MSDFKTNEVYQENCLHTMKRMPDNFIDLTVTSPPYDDLRDYKGYSFPFKKIAKQLFRVTKEGGIVVWVINDATVDGDETGTSFRQALYFKKLGFKLHDTMIYEKNGMSMPDSNRYYNVFEYMFVFSKGKPKSINLIADRKNRWGGQSSFGKVAQRQRDGSIKKTKKIKINEVGVRFNIWKIFNGKGYTTKDEIAYQHPAMFPEKLARDHIYSWSNEGDIVYDPFAGSGTTGKMAHLLNRKWILSEMSEEFVELIHKRLEKYLTQTTLKL